MTELWQQVPFTDRRQMPVRRTEFCAGCAYFSYSASCYKEAPMGPEAIAASERNLSNRDLFWLEEEDNTMRIEKKTETGSFILQYSKEQKKKLKGQVLRSADPYYT